jgi:hypothetical protein
MHRAYSCNQRDLRIIRSVQIPSRQSLNLLADQQLPYAIYTSLRQIRYIPAAQFYINRDTGHPTIHICFTDTVTGLVEPTGYFLDIPQTFITTGNISPGNPLPDSTTN